MSKILNHSGWGIKNLDWFSMSLRLKSFWMVLNGKGLWSQVITTKYLKRTTLESWLRAKCFTINGPSIMWNGFLHTFTWLGRSLSWQAGNGRNIQVGVDPIIGTSLSPFLPQDLIIFLQDCGITTLQHARNSFLASPNYWLSSADLNLGGAWALSWNDYVAGLEYGGIRSKYHEDKILWTVNQKDENVIAAIAYDQMINVTLSPIEDSFAK